MRSRVTVRAEGANLDLRTLTDRKDMSYDSSTLFSLYRLNGVCEPGLADRILASCLASPILAVQRAKPEHPGRWFGPLASYQSILDKAHD